VSDCQERQRVWAAVRRGALAIVRFFGPVAGAVRGELSKEERLRALSKALVVGAATRASLWSTLSAPETLSDLIVPLTAAALAGLLDAVSRLQQGEAQPTAAIPAAPDSHCS
jgi:hypothetical protein